MTPLEWLFDGLLGVTLLLLAPAWLVYRGLFIGLLGKIPSIPPGDLLVFGEHWLRRIPRPTVSHPAHKQEHDAVLQPHAPPRFIAGPERLMGRWQVAIGLLLLVVLGIFYLSA